MELHRDSRSEEILWQLRADQKARRRRRLVLFTAIPLLALMLIGAASPILGLLLPKAAEVVEARRTRALYALAYPDHPVSAEESRLHRGSRVSTPFLALSSEPRGLVVQVYSLQERGRIEPARGVSLTLAGTGTLMLPAYRWERVPLVLITPSGRHLIFSTEAEALQVSRPEEPDHTSLMRFTVPTAVYLDWIKQTEPAGAVGNITWAVPEDSREVLIDLAATLKPIDAR